MTSLLSGLGSLGEPGFGKTVVIKYSDMNPEKLNYVIDLARRSMERYVDELTMAKTIRRRLDMMDQEHWHVFVGRKFSSVVNHEIGSYAYFYMGHMGFLIFKCGTPWF